MTKKLLLAAALLAAVPALAAEPEPTPKPADAPTLPPEEKAKPDKIGQSPFRVRTSRPNYSEMEVARPLALQKEWAEFALTYRVREVTEVTDPNGEVHDAGYTYTHSWVTFDTRYGFTRNLTMYMSIPFAAGSSLVGVEGEGNVMESGMGDIHFGLLWQVFHREKQSSMSSLAVQWDTKQPSGNESPGAPGARHLSLGTGTTNFGMYVAGKQRIGPVAAVLRGGYVHKFSGTNMWVRDTDAPTLGLNGRFKPGDEIVASGHLIVQPLALVAVTGGADYVSRLPASIGPTSDEVSPGEDLVEMKDTDFEALNANVAFLLSPSVNWDFSIGASVPVMSRNSGALFPLEDLSQSYGTTLISSAIFRW
jgi:hypothetical protein